MISSGRPTVGSSWSSWGKRFRADLRECGERWQRTQHRRDHGLVAWRIVTLVDTNVVRDLITDDQRWADWSQSRLEHAALAGPVFANGVVYADCRHASVSQIGRCADRRPVRLLYRRVRSHRGVVVADTRRAALSQLFPQRSPDRAGRLTGARCGPSQAPQVRRLDGRAFPGDREGEESPGSTETRCRLTTGGGDPRESATENRPPRWPSFRTASQPARVKRWGKSPPRDRQRKRHGKPHREQDQIGAARRATGSGVSAPPPGSVARGVR